MTTQTKPSLGRIKFGVWQLMFGAQQKAKRYEPIMRVCGPRTLQSAQRQGRLGAER